MVKFHNVLVFEGSEGLFFVLDEALFDLVHFSGFNDLDGDGLVLFVIVA